MKERFCSPDIELIAIGLHPYYLPWEFTIVITITVYIPPSGNADAACDVIQAATAALQTKHPEPSSSSQVTSTTSLSHPLSQCFTSLSNAECKRVQRELKHSIRESKENYRRKLESKLENNDTRDVWRGMREITGFQRKGGGTAEGNEQRTNEFNLFFNRFNSSSPSSPPAAPPSNHLWTQPQTTPHQPHNPTPTPEADTRFHHLLLPLPHPPLRTSPTAAYKLLKQSPLCTTTHPPVWT